MRGRFYIRLHGCDCGREHTIVDPDFYFTLQTFAEVPHQFSTQQGAIDHAAEFIEWQRNQGGNFVAFEIVGVN